MLCFSVLLCLRPVVDSVRDYPFLIVTSVFSTVYCIALFYIKINNKKIMIIIIITTNDRTQRCTNRIIKIFVIFRVFQILFLGNITDCYTIFFLNCRNSICLHFHTHTYITKLYDKCDDFTFPIVSN